MGNIEDLSSSGFDPMSPLDGLDGDGVDQVISGISEVTSGLPYESYVSLPKLEATPMLHVLDCLSKRRCLGRMFTFTLRRIGFMSSTTIRLISLCIVL